MKISNADAKKLGLDHLIPARARRKRTRPPRPTADVIARTEPGQWIVVIEDWRPISLNKLMRMHWAKRQATLKAEAFLVAVSCAMAGVPKATSKRRIQQTQTLTKRDQRYDADNAYKSLNDALVKAEVLVDDGPDWVETLPPEYERGDRRCTRITIRTVP